MKKNKLIIIGIIITILIDYLASTYGSLIDLKIDFFPRRSFGLHTIMLLLSILAIYLFKKYVDYRIELPKFKTLLKPIGFGLLVSLLSTMLMGIAMNIAGVESQDIKMPTSNLSILQIIIFVFLYSSIAEEMLFRGFLLNILKPIREKGISLFNRKVSLGVIISAIMFGLIHIIPFNSDNNMIFTIGMFISPTILGIFAGYYQEKFDNNAYAIIVHMSGNLMGIIGTIVMTLNS